MKDKVFMEKKKNWKVKQERNGKQKEKRGGKTTKCEDKLRKIQCLIKRKKI